MALDDEKCAVCNSILHSITMRKLGDYKVCRDCDEKYMADSLRNAINNVVANFIRAAKLNRGEIVSY